MRRMSYWSRTIQTHVRNMKSWYIFVTVLFLMGMIFGALIVNTLDLKQQEGLVHYLSYFFRGLEQDSITEPAVAFQHSFGDHLKTLGIMWLLGLSVIGIPILLLFVFYKGLVIGFTVGFLVHQLSLKGLWFASLSIVPQNLVIVPAILIIAVSGIHFSVTLVQNRLLHHRGTIYPEFVSFSILATCMMVVFLGASVWEAYLTPELMKGNIPSFTITN